jgi:cytidylate kinase
MEKEKQLIISVSREYGSGGHVIAEALAGQFGLPFYDRNLLKELAKQKSMDMERLEKYDEAPKIPLLSRRIRGFSNSPEENIAYMQFEYLQEKAQNGESFVVVGRCAESVLKAFPALISIFVLADMDFKIRRIVSVEHLSEEEAELQIIRESKKRKDYHNYYCTQKWGDSRNYDICINSASLGIDETTRILSEFIKAHA